MILGEVNKQHKEEKKIVYVNKRVEKERMATEIETG